jgi:[acyl-carrier-protein] S-malonyltransferase
MNSTPVAPIALLFPGQAAQQLRMLEGVRHLANFKARLEIVGEYVGGAVLGDIETGKDTRLAENRTASLLTVLVSTLSLDHFRELCETAPRCYAGYSVGQWTAMYAAGMLDFELLVRILSHRAQLMDECATREPGGMCATIGISEKALTDVLAELRVQGHRVYVSNRNACGQFSIAGANDALELAMNRLGRLGPKKLLRLPVSGPWHCPILAPAESAFAQFLSSVVFRSRSAPVVDNVTGTWLPMEPAALCRSLAMHLTHPVDWQRGVCTMTDTGCQTFFEVGYGLMLTKFGFFIDRERTFLPFYDRYPTGHCSGDLVPQECGAN